MLTSLPLKVQIILRKYANNSVSRTRNWGRTLFYRTRGRLFQKVIPRRSNGQTIRQFVVRSVSPDGDDVVS